MSLPKKKRPKSHTRRQHAVYAFAQRKKLIKKLHAIVSDKKREDKKIENAMNQKDLEKKSNLKAA